MQVGITGATGFLGYRMTSIFQEKGVAIRCLARETSIAKLKGLEIEIVVGDLHDETALKTFVAGLDVCFHLAALVGFATKERYREVNVQGTENLCQAILAVNPSCRLVFCSSIAALKVNKYCSITRTNYAKSKYRAGKLVDEYVKNKKLQAVTVCPGMIYGPGDKNFIPTLLKYLKRNQVFLVSGGEKHAPLIYIDDLCELFWRAGIYANVIGKTYIGIGRGEMGIHDFIRLLAERMDYPIPKRVVPKILILPLAIFMEMLWHLLKKKKSPLLSKRTIDVLSLQFIDAFQHAQIDLGWSPQVSIEKGLDFTFDWYQEHT